MHRRKQRPIRSPRRRRASSVGGTCLLETVQRRLRAVAAHGFRVIARKDGERVRLYSRPGNDLTYRFRLIVAGLARLPARSCHHRRRGRGLGPSSTTLARRVPPLSQGPFNAQNFSEPLIISEPEISF